MGPFRRCKRSIAAIFRPGIVLVISVASVASILASGGVLVVPVALIAPGAV